MIDPTIDVFGAIQQWIFEGIVQPIMFGTGMGSILEEGYRATGWVIVGVLQILLMLSIMQLLERWRPVEVVDDKQAVRVDIVYTLIHRLGVFRVLMFLSIDPVWDWTFGKLRLYGLSTWSLDDLWPGVTDIAVVSFLLYLVLFDLVDYLLHRGQHSLRWWWQLHSLHHSQRQMTMWSDNRNHFLDDVLRDSAFVLVALLVGIGPGQFVAVTACMQLVESLSHANVRLSFGWFGRVLVSPQYHRFHHAIGVGHESKGAGSLGGHNFAVLFPVWDILFRSANFEDRYEPTGIRDQLHGRDYGRGFWSQQWQGLVRLFGGGRA